jgi:hypothetical protein
MTSVCRCGHGRDAHTHYRAGTDCSARGCPCPWWRNQRARWGWTLAGLAAAAVLLSMVLR